MSDGTTLTDLNAVHEALTELMYSIENARDAAQPGSHAKTVLRKAANDANKVEMNLKSLLEVADAEPVVLDHINNQPRIPINGSGTEATDL